MKILLVQDHLRSGGTERHTVLLARHFALAGHTTTLATFRPGGALSPIPPTANLAVFALQKRDSRLDWWAPGLLRRARQLAPDVVLCMGRMANCYGAALQRALPGSVVVATLRTGKPLPVLFRRSLSQVRHIIANSTDARERVIRDHQVAPERVSVIHNALVFAARPVDLELRARQRAAQGVPADGVVLLDVAMFRPEKNQIALIDLLADLKSAAPVHLWLAGDGPALAACQARAVQRGVTDRVRFLGWTADPAPLYAAADIAVHASRRESLSNFLIEAQAHGLPAVAYHALGVGETFLNGESGYLIEPDDAPAFRSALERLIADGGMRARMAPIARDFAQRNFSTENQIAAYLKLFASLLLPDSSA